MVLAILLVQVTLRQEKQTKHWQLRKLVHSGFQAKILVGYVNRKYNYECIIVMTVHTRKEYALCVGRKLWTRALTK